MASRCSERSAMANGEAAGLPEMLITRRATPANCAANASTTMPPSEAPTTADSLFDAERAHHFVAAARDVLDRQVGEIEPIGQARSRIDRGRARGTEAAAQRIHADDEVTIGVDGLAGADHLFPPALRWILRRRRRVRRGRQPGEQQDGVVARRVELAPGFVGDAAFAQRAAAPERKRIRQACKPGGRTKGHLSKLGCSCRAQCRLELARRAAHGSGSPPSAMPSNKAVDR